eukprot:1585200-Amphidinium_carterae.1
MKTASLLQFSSLRAATTFSSPFGQKSGVPGRAQLKHNITLELEAQQESPSSALEDLPHDRTKLTKVVRCYDHHRGPWPQHGAFGVNTLQA